MMHSFRLFRKWITSDARAAESFMDRLRAAQGPAIRGFSLTLVKSLLDSSYAD
jgi:hypothetical protein